MKNILIVGSSGMVGQIILRECLASDSVKRVISLVRKPSGIAHNKLREENHADYSNYQAVSELFENTDVAHFCIGVYTGAVPDPEFKQITVDYAQAFGKMLKLKSPDARLCFLSGAGADLTEKSRMSFARYKGMAENYLIKLELGAFHTFRPAYIYPVVARDEPNLSYRIFRFLYPIMRTIYPKGVITSEQLGRAMYHVGIVGHELSILENSDIKKI